MTVRLHDVCMKNDWAVRLIEIGQCEEVAV